MRRYHGLFRPSGTFFRHQFSADYTISMFGFDFRQGHGAHAMVGIGFVAFTPARRPLEERHAISLGTISSTREWWHPIMRRTLGYFIQNNFRPYHSKVSVEPGRDAMVDMLSPELHSGTEEADEAQVPAVSWAAIVAGGVASAALTLVLLAFGAGIGLSAVSPWANSGISSTTFNIGAGVYLCMIAVMASSIGGYLVGRLRTKWVGVHTHEVYFRDTAHGFFAWAFATLLRARVLGSAASNIVGGASAGLTQAAGSAAAQSAGPVAGFVDSLLRADPADT